MKNGFYDTLLYKRDGDPVRDLLELKTEMEEMRSEMSEMKTLLIKGLVQMQEIFLRENKTNENR